MKLLLDRERVIYDEGVLYDTGEDLQNFYDAVRLAASCDGNSEVVYSRLWGMYRRTITVAMHDCGYEPRDKRVDVLKLLKSKHGLPTVTKQDAIACDDEQADDMASWDNASATNASATNASATNASVDSDQEEDARPLDKEASDDDDDE